MHGGMLSECWAVPPLLSLFTLSGQCAHLHLGARAPRPWVPPGCGGSPAGGQAVRTLSNPTFSGSPESHGGFEVSVRTFRDLEASPFLLKNDLEFVFFKNMKNILSLGPGILDFQGTKMQICLL